MTNILLSLAKNTKNEPFFDILMTITPGVNMITRKMTPIFSSTPQALSVGIFHFCISRPSKFSPPLHFALFCKMQIYMPKMTLSPLLTWISFLYIKFANFLYIICFVPNLIPIWSQSHGLYLLLKFIKSKIKKIRMSHKEN